MSKITLRNLVRNTIQETVKKTAIVNKLLNGWQSWSSAAMEIPFDGFKGKGEGVGRGEERLAVEFNGHVMGGNVSYDVVDNENRKWEVKEPERKNGGGRVRIEQEGIRVVAPVLRSLSSTLTKIIRFFDNGFLNKMPEIRNIFSNEDISKIYFFLKEHSDGIFRGEIGLGRIKAFHELLSMISDHINNLHIENSSHNIVHTRSGVKLDIDDSAMIHVALSVAKKINVPLAKMLSELGISTENYVLSELSGLAFKNPDEFMKSTWGSIKSGKMFNDVDGVVLVMDSGYRVIQRHELDTELIFHSITKGKPKLVIRNIE